MASGCDFTCDNAKCEHHKKGIIVLAPWPIGDVNKVITAKNVRINKHFQSSLIEFRDKHGIKHCCINYPNVDKIPVVGYRVNMWCQKCKYLAKEDIMLDAPMVDKTPEEMNAVREKVIYESNCEDKNCPICNDKMKSYSQLMEKNDGVDCPFCGVRMTKNTWFSNETSEEIIRNVK